MNIFQVLSQGKSRLHEPSMSAMLGYLLDSSKDHGLGDLFIRKFLHAIDAQRFEEVLSATFIDSQVSLEEPYQLDGSRKDIDIQLLLLDKSKREQHRIIIENKIKVGAANPKQLMDYYEAVLTDESQLEALTMVFLTPNLRTNLLAAEYANLELKRSTHAKYWIHWSAEERSICGLTKDLLSLEAAGEINPINEYMRHTLKAFVQHALLVTEPSEKLVRAGEDIGEIVEDAVISLQGGSRYRVVRRDSSQIQVFNELTGEKEVARRIMAQYIDENKLPIDHPNLNTRSIGRRFFDIVNAS